MVTKEYIKVSDIKNILGVSKQTSYEIARSIDHVKFGNNLRVDADAFKAWLESKRRSAVS